MSNRVSFIGLLGLLVGACGETHSAPPDGGVIVPSDAPVRADAPVIATDAPVTSDLLATCLADGRGLREVTTVDNNDSADHGALLRLGVSPAGRIAAAGADGTLKLWTLDAELLGTFNGAILTYGPEIPSAPITDIAFDGESILVGDVRGIVLQMEMEGGLFPIGGTTPEIAIRALAFDAAHDTLAHAQEGDVAPLLIRTPEETLELTTDIDVSDLFFDANGDLWLAGTRSSYLAIERRARGAWDVVAESILPEAVGAFTEMARLDDGEIAAVSDGYVMLGDTFVELAGGRSIALATDGESTVALVAGSGGLTVLDAGEEIGASLFTSAVGDAVTVRVDSTGRLAVVGGSDATIHVLGCAD